MPIHPDGRKFVLGLAGVDADSVLADRTPLGWLGVIATAYCAYFFRDPERVTPKRAGLVVSAADGRITGVGKVAPPRGARAWRRAARPASRCFSRCSTCISCARRSAANWSAVNYVPGKFLNAELDKASEENERLALCDRDRLRARRSAWC